MSAENRAADDCDAIDQTTVLLTRLFRYAATPVIGSILLSGCAGDEGRLPHSQHQSPLSAGPMHCVDTVWRPMSALALIQQVEYAAVQTHMADGRPRVVVRDAAGEPCASASEPRLCAAEMRRLALLETEPKRSHLLTTAGDTVQVFESLERILELLGPIDTQDEALLLLEHEGYPIGCVQGEMGEATQVGARGDGYRVLTRTPDLCGNERTQYTIDVARNGTLTVVNTKAIEASGCTIGRRPPNLCASFRSRAEPSASTLAPGAVRSLGEYFARATRLEAASVDAFEQLSEELRLAGAPRGLRELARRSAEDEVRHAAATAALAERFGARPAAPVLRRRRLRSLAEVALDNAVEGCVQETFGAYTATVQAGLTRDRSLQRTLLGIAADETRHAALSWRLAAWCEPRLDARTRSRIRAARMNAVGALGAFSAFG